MLLERTTPTLKPAVLPTTSSAVIILDLTYDPGAGTFTLGNSELGTQEGPITGGFQIPLSAPGNIQINASNGFEFMTGLDDATTFLPLNTAQGAHLTSTSAAVFIEVQDLPETNRVLGFVLFIKPEVGPVNGLETPPIFITQGYFDPLNLALRYAQDTGNFSFQHDGFEMPVVKDQVLLRLGTSSSNQGPLTTVHLDDNDGSLQFISPHVVFKPKNGASVVFQSPTELRFEKAFEDGTGVGVSFVVGVSSGTGTFKVFSPDPIIIDKQIGTGGD